MPASKTPMQTGLGRLHVAVMPRAGHSDRLEVPVNASTKERWHKLLSFACAIVGMVHFTSIALRFTHDFILAAVIGGIAGSGFGGFAAGLLLMFFAEPVLLVYAVIGLALVALLRMTYGGTWIGMVLAW